MLNWRHMKRIPANLRNRFVPASDRQRAQRARPGPPTLFASEHL
jgi:hypothetical protein